MLWIENFMLLEKNAAAFESIYPQFGFFPYISLLSVFHWRNENQNTDWNCDKVR